MAFDDTPTTWIAGWEVVTTNCVFPIASFPELTSAEAAGTTGDIRKIVWALLEKMFLEYDGTATNDRPTKWTCSKTHSINASTGVVTHSFTNTFYTEIATQELVDEA